MQTNITSATVEHPGYLEIRMTDGATIIIGAASIEYYAPDTAPEDGDPACWADFGDAFHFGDAVIDCECEHGGGNVFTDYVTTDNGACIAVTAEGVYVYGNVDEAHDPDWPPLLSLMFDGSAH